MADPRKRLTVIVVPQTGRRTFSFGFSPLWLGALALLIAGLAVTIWYQAGQNRELQTQIAEVDDLRRANRLQQAEIESMTRRVQDTDEKLGLLQRLEEQIRELLDPGNAPSRGASSGSLMDTRRGRGGPTDPQPSLDNVPTLGTVLPPEVRAHLFAKRDTLALDLRLPSATKNGVDSVLAIAMESSARLDDQLDEMESLLSVLEEGKKGIEAQLDYLAHRPSGFPISGALITDRFGSRWSPFGWGWQSHNGLDLAQDYGIPVVSTAEGVIIHSGWKSGGYGYTVMVDHGYGLVTLYAHLSDTNVEFGETVKRGSLIGWLGSTGSSTGPHVHYEVHYLGNPVDPLKYIQ